ncbi:organic solute transporter Ostalpha-domain-containing protein [Clohesyomyces aquaticus]|uniref:Organic solute transporter Ostalpha-domain-containing protein n=1 Tax=Clohesyomyces aquaticus TaxID=1231657 RepID=A0A1Y1ZIG8_9PLEO|nr:organic solute transporter Ostalpha-domain-containing protein [Clohesyomyces aquaticus]
MSTGTLHTMGSTDLLTPGGTGDRFARAVTIVAGVSSLVATLITIVSIWLQAKNYRKPLLQRYVVRILLMVPIYAASSWASLVSLKAAFWIGPLRDVYEAFTIYTFFQLLTNFIGGERALIILMTGRPPVSHPWPLNLVFPKVDISDPHTFLAIKRGILQYTWLKPILAVAAIVMKATGTYKEGYIGVSSGYFWSGLIYNISITVSLYALAMFWVCMSHDLKPFRPMPKFLCIKGIIFASYWQGFFLSILVFLRAIPGDVPGYTPDNLAAAIQDALICFEMPFFAISHWYAFSWHDYADNTISAARMPVKYALRDSFGPRDLIEDAKETFGGKGHYEYRYFDAHDNVLAHEESSSREARVRQGMRYERGGKGKYWIPRPGQHENEPLLSKVSSSRARTMSPGAHRALSSSKYGSTEQDEDPTLNPEDERLFDNARALEFGDWNAHRPSRENRFASPNIVTASTNRNLLQPTRENRQRRKSRIKEIQHSAHDKGKHRSSSSSGGPSSSKSKTPIIGNLLRQKSTSSSSSGKSDHSQLVDLVVEDHEAEEIEQVRARKEGGPGWNEVAAKHFVHTYPQDGQQEEVREGFNPDHPEPHNPESAHNLDSAFKVGDEETEEDKLDRKPLVSEEAEQWEQRDYDHEPERPKPQYGSFPEERDVWGER